MSARAHIALTSHSRRAHIALRCAQTRSGRAHLQHRTHEHSALTTRSHRAQIAPISHSHRAHIALISRSQATCAQKKGFYKDKLKSECSMPASAHVALRKRFFKR